MHSNEAIKFCRRWSDVVNYVVYFVGNAENVKIKSHKNVKQQLAGL